MTIYLYDTDLPDGLDFGASVAVDSETMGLNPIRDRLCLVQLSSGDGNAHLVQFKKGSDFNAPNLKALMANPKVTKFFHYARFDLGVIYKYLGVMATPCYCTKIVSRITRTSTDKHGLKNLCKELLGLDLAKQQQTSDWGAETLSDAQKEYAASDVLYLHSLVKILDTLLEREGRTDLAQAMFEFLPTRSKLDLLGWADVDLFSHA